MTLKNLNNAWLDPYGKYVTNWEGFSEGSAWHEDLAKCIIATEQYIEQDDFFGIMHFVREQQKLNYCYEYLESKGWVRLHGYAGLPPKWIVPFKGRINSAQETAILDWCIANNKKYDDVIAK